MADLLKILQIGKSALLANQLAMQTTSHNIANANTEGYSRQRVIFSSNSPESNLLGTFGTGVSVQNIERLRDKFIDLQIFNEISSFGQFEFSADSLQFIEDILNEPSNFSLGSALKNFFNAWNELANDPGSHPTRVLIKENAITLVQSFHRLDSKLSDFIKSLNKDLRANVEKINGLAKRLAELNDQIGQNKNQPADLLDRRNQLIEELSKLINIKVLDDGQGNVNIAVGGQFLIFKNSAHELQVNAESKVIFKDSGKAVEINNGILKGIMHIRDTVVSELRNDLNTLAQNIAEQVNQIHRQGYNLKGSTNLNFFKENIQGAGDFALDAEILKDPALIAASAEPDAAGDNNIALQIALLEESPIMRNSRETFQEFYNSFLVEVGTQTREAKFRKENSDLILQNLRARQQAISGVSLDEEMANLITLQNYYSAAARIITTVDEMTQTILNLL